MSPNTNHRLPSFLEERLEQEPRSERETLERVWHMLEEAGAPAGVMPDPDGMWEELEKSTSERHRPAAALPDRLAPSRPARVRTRFATPSTTWLVAAAVVAAMLIGSFLWWSLPVSVHAPPGDRIAVSLPDGSSVALGGGSSLSYQRGFLTAPLLPAKERTVTLNGEAFFDVRSAARPFVVETFNARVEVVGTRFDVQAWSRLDRPETCVTLASGVVRLAARSAAGDEVTLERSGQMSRIVGTAAGPTLPRATDLDQVLAWREQGFFAADQPLSAILARLEHRFGIQIVLAAPSASTDQMTLHYPRQVDLETILHDICMAKGLKFRRTSRGYEIVDDLGTQEADRT